MVNPILVALDVPEAGEAIRLARLLRPHVGGFKVGLELLMGHGPDVVTGLGELQVPVFVDAKLHDIPNTVARAAAQLGRRGARWVTAHAGGGAQMVRAAVEGLAEGSGGAAGILGVTVLTSLDETGLRESGVTRDLGSQVVAMTALSAEAGAEGVICSVHEIGLVRSAKPSLKVVTPGIRLAEQGLDDQQRVATPSAAIKAGADYLVVGRAITGAVDMVAAARRIADEIETMAERL